MALDAFACVAVGGLVIILGSHQLRPIKAQYHVGMEASMTAFGIRNLHVS